MDGIGRQGKFKVARGSQRDRGRPQICQRQNQVRLHTAVMDWFSLNSNLNCTHFLSVPRDMGLWSARRLREALETAAKSTGSKKQGPPIPEDHRRDQDPSRFWAWKPHVKMLIPPKQLSVLYKFWTRCMRFITFKIQKSMQVNRVKLVIIRKINKAERAAKYTAVLS